jgi:hypothetical protein
MQPPITLCSFAAVPQDPGLLLELYEAMGQQEAAAELHLRAALELAAGTPPLCPLIRCLSGLLRLLLVLLLALLLAGWVGCS